MDKFKVTWKKSKKKGSVSSQDVTFLTLEDAIWYSETVKSDPKHFEVEVIPVFMTEINIWEERYWALRRWVEKHYDKFAPSTEVTEEEIELFWNTLEIDIYDQR